MISDRIRLISREAEKPGIPRIPGFFMPRSCVAARMITTCRSSAVPTAAQAPPATTTVTSVFGWRLPTSPLLRRRATH